MTHGHQVDVWSEADDVFQRAGLTPMSWSSGIEYTIA